MATGMVAITSNGINCTVATKAYCVKLSVHAISAGVVFIPIVG